MKPTATVSNTNPLRKSVMTSKEAGFHTANRSRHPSLGLSLENLAAHISSQEWKRVCYPVF